MKDFLKKFLKITASCALITSGILVAGTVFVTKKIDSSDDKEKDEANSIKDKITNKIKEGSEKAINSKASKKSIANLENKKNQAKKVLADAEGRLKNKIDEVKKSIDEK
ncbi:hypothetical protein [Oenococcus oeni]|uniref:hypothetical protein n=1 Tax=Oenococcus oeni TaxID=1247 RepID=UPI000277B8AE|nr:hypothetical protein [Oenococcus oeni]EJN98984.1 hypothetical protein AWRIB418_1736 [Oenococcus oeni AWRIB418]OIM39265.1 hypothetical protein ATX72_06025 [Oenococcus oeni]QGR01585.1 hypothetical protein E4R25_06885 [Oenococcus oeni]TEU22160.1 hypothetical protein E2147_09010 [Oenococcus oeni]TEU52347.1 hypothetical protein E2145_08965 [Oenococcus oeni]